MAARLKTKAAEMLDKIKAGTPFADVAAADKLKVEWRPGIKRAGTAPGLSPSVVAEVFKTPQDGAGSVEGASPTERIVFHVTEIKVPPLDPDNADAKRIDEALKSALGAGPGGAISGLRCENDVGVTINQNALSQATGGHAELTAPCRSSLRPTPSPRATSAARRRCCGPRWSPIWKRRSRRS